MFVSRSLDYAIRSLIVLSNQTANLRQLADYTGVPKSYLAKLMRALVKAEIIRSDAGAHGGYHLARRPEHISLKSIYETVEGQFRTVVCDTGQGACELHDDCSQVGVWHSIEKEISGVLERHTLADFAPTRAPQRQAFIPVEQVHV